MHKHMRFQFDRTTSSMHKCHEDVIRYTVLGGMLQRDLEIEMKPASDAWASRVGVIGQREERRVDYLRFLSAALALIQPNPVH